MRIRMTCVILCMLMMPAASFAADMSQNSEDSISRAPYYQKQNAIILRSSDFHNGDYNWQIIKDDASSDSGDSISLAGYTSEVAIDAIVPGTVLNTLVYNKVYPEPYFGLNNANEINLIPDITEVGRDFYTYWFRTEFELTSAFTGKQVMMRFDGINYRAEIWLNGQKLGDMVGMFNRGFFDITDAVNFQGLNALAVLVRPVDVLGGFEDKYSEPRVVGENRNGGDGTIGKNVTQLMSVGWDFTFSDGIRDRNTGIWKDITIFPVDSVELRNPFIKSDLSMPDMTSSRQDITVEAVNQTGTSQTGVLRAVIEGMGVDIEKTVNLGPYETKTVHFSPDEYELLICHNPKLWWPIHKGPQNLYRLTLTFEQNGQVSDTEKTRFAVRHVTSDRNTPDTSRQFYINGKPIFLHGTNWIPEAMLRKTDERMYAEMRYTQQAGINFIRFWAGGIVESDYFYDLCDELGIMVSMEFWLTGDTDLPSDFDLYRANFADTIKALRNHPCIVYYISANERGTDNIVPVEDLVDSLDGTRGYQAASEIDGIHDGSPYKYVNPMFYYDDSASSRGSRIYGLCPEYGTPCLPTLDSLEEMMDVDDIWPINETVWNYHDGGGFHDMISKYVPAMQQYGSIESAEEMAWKGQMVGAVGYRSIWECWTYNRLNNGDRYTSGVWFWYHNSPTRQVCGRMWDWSLEPTAALYYSQDAHEPIHAQYDFIKNTVSVNNEFYTPFAGTVTMRVFNEDMTLKYQKQTAVTVGSDTIANDVIHAQLPSDLSPVHFIRLDVTDTNGNSVADTFYWRSNNAYAGETTYTGPLYTGFQDIEKLPKVALSSAVQKQDGKYLVTLKNPSQALAFMIRVKLADPNTQKPVRPSFYSDNFFNLLPGEEKVITIESYESVPSVVVVVKGWNVLEATMPIQDTSPNNNLPDVLNPVNGATGVLPIAALTWKAGLAPNDLTTVNPAIKKHYLWMSNGNPADLNLSLVTSIDITDYADPAADGRFNPAPHLNYDSTYYWMIEEGLDNGVGGTYPAGDPHNLFGSVWSFQTIATIPEITVQPASVRANPAETIQFHIGYSTLSMITGVTWYKDDTPLSDGGDITIAWDQTSSTLSIANVDTSDAGEYYAVVTGYGGNSDPTSTVYLMLHKPLAWYQFEQNAADSAGTNDGTVVGGMNYVTGKNTDGGQAYAADPDGTNYVMLTTNAYPKTGLGNGMDAFTYSCWVKLAPGEGGIILGVFNEGSTTGLRFSINSVENDISVYMRQEGGASINPRTSTLATDGQWHFVAVTYDGSDMKIYVDSVRKATATKTLTNFAAWQFPMTVVAVNSRGSVNNRFSGQIDDLKIYSYAFTSDEIAQEYLGVEGGWICDTEKPELAYDFDGDCQIDLGDLAIFAATWLDSNRIYAQ